MRRHLRTSHGNTTPYSSPSEPKSNDTYPPPPPSPHSPPPPPHSQELCQQRESFKFQHPFTMIVAGPTMSGKTTWMKTLLLNKNNVIFPPPDRIVWIYKRWQPLYDGLQRQIPKMQFIQNIPLEMNDDSFFDIKERTFVIIDDMMKDATENKNVCEMFIEGAHHRNLSVACIMQNLFNKGKGNRTMNLNTQYLVVFKNPRDQLQITALARQMFPGNSRKLMDVYQRAVEEPHGSLLIDFKQSTPESQRLLPNVLKSRSDQKKVSDSKREYLHNEPVNGTDDVHYSSCETDSEEDDRMDESDDDTSGFDLWINEIWEKRYPEFQTKVGDLISAGALEDEARDRVKNDMMEADREFLLNTYSDFLKKSFSLMNCTLHKKIRHNILCQVNLNDMSIEDAISQISHDYKKDFDVLFNENV